MGYCGPGAPAGVHDIGPLAAGVGAGLGAESERHVNFEREPTLTATSAGVFPFIMIRSIPMAYRSSIHALYPPIKDAAA